MELSSTAMERKTDEQVLAEAEELLKHNQESMEQQRRVILGLERAGGDVTDALEVLAKLLKDQNEHERRLKYLRTWCGKSSADVPGYKSVPGALSKNNLC